MKRIINKTIEAEVLDFWELSTKEEIVLKAAVFIRKNAQASYSRFLVGAAVESLKSQAIYAGVNVERCTFTQTTHAEQNAIDSMISAEGPTKIKRIAVVGGAAEIEIKLPPERVIKKIETFYEIPVPCGHCLQIIWENCFGDSTVEILTICKNGEIAKIKIGDTLPLKFGPADLGGGH